MQCKMQPVVTHITICKSKSCLRSNRVINFDRHSKVNNKHHTYVRRRSFSYTNKANTT